MQAAQGVAAADDALHSKIVNMKLPECNKALFTWVLLMQSCWHGPLIFGQHELISDEGAVPCEQKLDVQRSETLASVKGRNEKGKLPAGSIARKGGDVLAGWVPGSSLHSTDCCQNMVWMLGMLWHQSTATDRSRTIQTTSRIVQPGSTLPLLPSHDTYDDRAESPIRALHGPLNVL